MSIEEILKNFGFPVVALIGVGIFLKWYVPFLYQKHNEYILFLHNQYNQRLEYLHEQYNKRLEKRDDFLKITMSELKEDRTLIAQELKQFAGAINQFKELIELKFKK